MLDGRPRRPTLPSMKAPRLRCSLRPITSPRVRKTLGALGVLGLVILSGPAAAQLPEQQSRQRLVGVWKGFTVEGRGENPERGPVKLELRITEKTITGLEFKGANVVNHGEGPFTLDLSREPKHLDAWKVNEAGRKQTYLGIYTLEGDTFKWCVSPQKIRPETFETRKGQFLLVLRRHSGQP